MTSEQIKELLKQVKYADVPHEPLELPARIRHPDYRREPVKADMIVPEVY